MPLTEARSRAEGPTTAPRLEAWSSQAHLVTPAKHHPSEPHGGQHEVHSQLSFMVVKDFPSLNVFVCMADQVYATIALQAYVTSQHPRSWKRGFVRSYTIGHCCPADVHAFSLQDAQLAADRHSRHAERLIHNPKLRTCWHHRVAHGRDLPSMSTLLALPSELGEGGSDRHRGDSRAWSAFAWLPSARPCCPWTCLRLPHCEQST